MRGDRIFGERGAASEPDRGGISAGLSSQYRALSEAPRRPLNSEPRNHVVAFVRRSVTPIMDKTANAAPAAKAAAGPTAVHSKPAMTLAASIAAPVIKL